MSYPEIGKPFVLTIDGGDPANQPLAMVKNCGYPKGWKYSGKTVAGTETRKFRLISVGYCVNWRELTEKLAAYGPMPEGQWLEAFKAAYPRHDGYGGPVGVADPSWVDPGGDACFPCVLIDGRSDFRLAGYHFVSWRWLVPASK